MEMTFVQKYSPENAKLLSVEDLLAMQNFTDVQLKELAETNPNKQYAYLVLHDSMAKTQIFSFSTWANLYNLRVKNKQRRYSALTFRELFRKNKIEVKSPQFSKVPVDLTADEVDNAIKAMNSGAPVITEQLQAEAEKVPPQAPDEATDDISGEIELPGAEEVFPDLTKEVIAAKGKAKGGRKIGSQKKK